MFETYVCLFLVTSLFNSKWCYNTEKYYIIMRNNKGGERDMKEVMFSWIVYTYDFSVDILAYEQFTSKKLWLEIRHIDKHTCTCMNLLNSIPQVIYLVEPLDELAFQSVSNFDGKLLVDAAKGEQDSDGVEGSDAKKKVESKKELEVVSLRRRDSKQCTLKWWLALFWHLFVDLHVAHVYYLTLTFTRFTFIITYHVFGIYQK